MTEDNKKELFIKFVQKHMKDYTNDEIKNYRYNVFKSNLIIADKRNEIEIKQGGSGS